MTVNYRAAAVMKQMDLSRRTRVERRLMLLAAMALLLGLVVAGSFYAGGVYSCGDGHTEGFRCVEPDVVAVCELDMACFGVNCPPKVQYYKMEDVRH